MAKVLLVLTNTGTSVSNLIRKFTRATYNHISISMKEDLSEMYSFGRRNPYIMLFGGFVHEHPFRGTFKRFKNTSCKILELNVSDESYAIMTDIVKNFVTERKKFKYNVRGLIKARKNVNFQKSYRKFYCSQFVRYLLVCGHIIPESFFGPVVAPEDFYKVPGVEPIFEGLLSDYMKQNFPEITGDPSIENSKYS